VFPFDLSAMKILVLLVLGIIIFGPEKVPKAVTEALGLIRRLQAMGHASVEELGKELGADFAGLRPRDLHPKAVLHRALSTTVPGLVDLSDLDRDIREALHPDQLLVGDIQRVASVTDCSPVKPQGSRFPLSQPASEPGQLAPPQGPRTAARPVESSGQDGNWMSVDEWLQGDLRP